MFTPTVPSPEAMDPGVMGLGAKSLDSDMMKMADSVLRQEDFFPLLDDYTASLDMTTIQLDSLDMAGPNIEEDLLVLSGSQGNSLSGLHGNSLNGGLGTGYNGGLETSYTDDLETDYKNGLETGYNGVLVTGYRDGLGQDGIRSTSGQKPQRSRRPRRSTKSGDTTPTPTLTLQDSAYADPAHQYPVLADLGLAGDTTPRKRQPKVSYSTLTEQERYQHIRELNNVASRNYREKKGKHLNQLEQREVQERLRSQHLNRKAEGLQQLRDQMEKYTRSFMRDHLGGGAMAPHSHT